MKTNEKIKVSVIIFYNKDRGYLSDAIESAENQTMQRDDYEIILQYADLSSAKNFNEGVRRAKGKYIKGLAEDDLFTSNSLNDLYNAAELNQLDVVVSNAINFYPDGKEVFCISTIPKTVSHLSEANSIHGGSVLHSRKALIDVGLMDESLNYGEEYDLNLKLAQAGYKFGYLDKITFRYRCWDEMKSMQVKVSSGKDFIMRKREIRNRINMKYINNHNKINQ